MSALAFIFYIIGDNALTDLFLFTFGDGDIDLEPKYGFYSAKSVLPVQNVGLLYL